MKTLFIIFFVLFLIVTGGASLGFIIKNENQEPSIYRVTRKDFTIMVQGKGKVKPVYEQEIAVPNDIYNVTIEKIPKEGSYIKKDDLALKLTTLQLESDNQQSQDQLECEKIEFKRDEIQAGIENQRLKANVMSGEESVEIHKAILKWMKQGYPPEEINKYFLKIKEDEVSYKFSQKELKTQADLKAGGQVSGLNYEKLRLELELLKWRVKQDQNYLAMLQQGKPSENLDLCRLNIKKSDIELKLSQFQQQIDEKVKELELKQKEFKIQRKTTKVNQISRQIESCTIPAPIDGYVIYSSDWGEEMHVGKAVWSGQNVLKIVRFDELKIVSMIDEKDIDRVKEGAEVEIEIQTNMTSRYKGKVTQIARVAKLKEKRDLKGAKAFEVTCSIINPDDMVKVHATAVTSIIVARYTNVITIPKDYIMEENHKKWVMVFSEAPKNKREISVLDEDENYCVVNTGLKDGETILIPSLSKEKKQ